MLSKLKPLITMVSLVLGTSAINAAETLTAEQIQQKTIDSINQSDVGLISIQHADGSVSRDLKGRYQMFSRLVIDENGNQKFICNAHPDQEFATHMHNTKKPSASKAVTEIKKVER